MLTFYSLISVYRVDKKKAEEVVGNPLDEFVFLHYVQLEEFLAMLRGEPYSKMAVSSVFLQLCTAKGGLTRLMGDGFGTGRFGDDQYTKLRCTDGVCEVPLPARSLQRHFHYFRDFDDFWQNQEEVLVPFTVSDTRAVLIDFFMGCKELSGELEVLRMLTPVCNAVYFTYKLDVDPPVVKQLALALTEAERNTQMQVHKLVVDTTLHQPHDFIPPTPVGILCAFESGRDYLAYHGALLSDYPSWLFVNAALHEDIGDQLVFMTATSAIESGFTDCVPYANERLKAAVVDGLRSYLYESGFYEVDPKVIKKVHDMLSGAEYPPYQVVLPAKE